MKSVYIITYGSDHGKTAVVPTENVYLFYETAFKRLVELNTPLVDKGTDPVQFSQQIVDRGEPFDGYYGIQETELNTKLEGFTEDVCSFGVMHIWHGDCGDPDWCDDIDDVLWNITGAAECYLEDQMEDEEEDE